MSMRYEGGIISATPPTLVAGAGASGAWTLEQQMQATAAGLWPANGPFYIEDVFSTWLYTGNGSTQTITNGIDLAGKGGLTWIKSRTIARAHFLTDTVRGAGKTLSSNALNAETVDATRLSAFTSSGFSLGTSVNVNNSSEPYVSWSLREQSKFFDVVSWAGTGAVSQVINHNLGSVPGFIIVKAYSGTSGSSNWLCYHRSIGNTTAIALNLTDASAPASISYWRNTDPTATQFTVGGSMNDTSTNFVAYLFAHNAGGFGLSGTDNVISCGSYTGNGSATGPEINLGYEPQYVLIKNASATGYWFAFDNMRGIATGGTDALLWPNVADAEANSTDNIDLTATGFRIKNSAGSINGSGNTLIYIAIRRGPMKVPTTGTSVFGLNARTGTGAIATVTGSAGVSDAVLVKNRGAAVGDLFASRLTGTGYLETSAATAEVAAGTTILQANPWDVMDGVKVGTTSTITNASANTYINYLFDRAPGFFDEVCYAGTGAAQNITHNLSVAPELVIIKSRSVGGSGYGWVTGSAYYPSWGRYIQLNTTSAVNGTNNAGPFNNTAPTSSVFTVNTWTETNGSGTTYVAYLFASCPGVSKVGSYTGTGTTLQINCGFTAGSRFVLIKRTDSTGDWYVWDSARGIVAGNDPYLLLNSTAAEVTGTDYVDTSATGFEISSTAPAAINASGGTFIFLAIA